MAVPVSAGVGLFLSILLGSAAHAADDPPDAVLRAKGLKRSGSAYLLPAETEVQKRLNAARALYRTASASAAQKREHDAQVEAATEQLRFMEQEVGVLNQQLAQAGSVQENNRLVATINAANAQMTALRRQAGDDARQAVGARLASNREDFIQAVVDLRQVVDATTKAYASLAADPDVKAALVALNMPPAKVKYTMGPSKTYLANVATLDRVEGSVLSEDVPLRKEGGVYWVDVTFNGKVSRSMVFDTGASSVVLPAELAEKIGLTPSAKDETVTARVADGTEVKARKTSIPSVRVGKFTIQNVECIVMPESKKDVPPLLGQTFQRNFSIKFNPDAGQLILSKVEAAEGDTAAPKAKASTKSSRAARKPGR